MTVERLREIRLSSGLSLSEAARRFGLSKQAVSRFELGQLRLSEPVLDRVVEELRKCEVHVTAEDLDAACGRLHPRLQRKVLANPELFKQVVES